MYKFVRKIILLGGLVLFCFILFSNILILLSSRDDIYENLEDFPRKEYALLLGTSKYTSGDLENIFYKERINAVVKLLDSGRVEKIILSGANPSEYYNEPETMKKDLINLGVAESIIYLDYAGLRTLDSIIRARNVFEVNDFVIISQKFHLQRALTIARLNNIDAVGYVAKNPPFVLAGKTYFREIFARIKLLGDILFRINPKFEN